MISRACGNPASATETVVGIFIFCMDLIRLSSIIIYIYSE